jgi:hypothetical protein
VIQRVERINRPGTERGDINLLAIRGQGHPLREHARTVDAEHLAALQIEDGDRSRILVAQIGHRISHDRHLPCQHRDNGQNNAKQNFLPRPRHSLMKTLCFRLHKPPCSDYGAIVNKIRSGNRQPNKKTTPSRVARIPHL